MRLGGRAAEAARTGSSDSSSGRAMVAPAPRRKVRRESERVFGFIVGSLLHVTMPEGIAQRDPLDEDRRLVSIGFQRLDTVVNDTLIEAIQLPAEGVAEQLTGQVADEFRFLLEQHGLQFARSVELVAGGQLADGVNGLAGLFGTESADRVEVLQAETERVHALMAGGALGSAAVDLQLLAEGKP